MAAADTSRILLRGVTGISVDVIGGTGRVAVRIALQCPFETTYTLQKSGAHFITVAGISAALNILHTRTKYFINHHVSQKTKKEQKPYTSPMYVCMRARVCNFILQDASKHNENSFSLSIVSL